MLVIYDTIYLIFLSQKFALDSSGFTETAFPKSWLNLEMKPLNKTKKKWLWCCNFFIYLFIFFRQKPGHSWLSSFQWLRGGVFHFQERGRVRYGMTRLMHRNDQKVAHVILMRGNICCLLLGSQNEEVDKKYAGLLEKKWTSVIRLQKKVTNENTFEISCTFLTWRNKLASTMQYVKW